MLQSRNNQSMIANQQSISIKRLFFLIKELIAHTYRNFLQCSCQHIDKHILPQIVDTWFQLNKFRRIFHLKNESLLN